MANWQRLAEILNKELGLTPYESRAYVALLMHGTMSPSDMARKAMIPRPRTYDVVQTLMEKGLAIEQSGKPQIYAATKPSQGLKNLLVTIEIETTRQLEEKRKAAQELEQLLSPIYEKSKHLKLERSKVWYTQRDAAFIAIYAEAIRNCEKEFLVASRSLIPPEEETLEAVRYALKKGVTVRVVRQITDSWTLEELEKYERVIKSGSQVRYLEVKEIPLRFIVFDERDVILVFPQTESKTPTPQAIEALWLRISPLAKILREYFEELWRKGKPMMPILEEIKKKKQSDKGKTSS